MTASVLTDGSEHARGVAAPASDVRRALDWLAIAYEYAVDAADEGVVEFAPFEGLAEVIRVLRAALAAETTP